MTSSEEQGKKQQEAHILQSSYRTSYLIMTHVKLVIGMLVNGYFSLKGEETILKFKIQIKNIKT